MTGQWNSLHSFYTSKEWSNVRSQLMVKRGMICDYCHKLIHDKYDCIGHHKTPLTMANVNDASVSLNLDNLMLVHAKCHNMIHNRFGTITCHRYLIYGAPCSGKKTWVSEIATKDDLVVNVDDIRFAITGGVPYANSNNTLGDVLAVRDLLLERVRLKATRAHNIYIVGGYPYIGERERLCRDLQLEPVFIDTPKEECLARLDADPLRDSKVFRKYIDDWFTNYVPA